MKEKTVYLLQHQIEPDTDLRGAARRWISQDSAWYLREQPADTTTEPWAMWQYSPPCYRQATANEIAIEIVNDPQLREALTFLKSPPGQVIENAIASIWLPQPQAKLLTAALTQAWKIVLDQDRPWWQRADALLGTLAGIGLTGFIIAATRNSK